MILDSCIVDTKLNPISLKQVFFSSFHLSTATLVFCVGSLALMCIWPMQSKSNSNSASNSASAEESSKPISPLFHWNPLQSYHSIYALVWYYVSYALCISLKHYFDDIACSSHPNSVSGHFNFYLFASLTLTHLLVLALDTSAIHPPVSSSSASSASQKRHSSISQAIASFYSHSFYRKHFLLYCITCICFFITAAIQLYRTYFYGFHSLRQIIYGSTLGLLSYAAFSHSLDAGLIITKKGTEKNRFPSLSLPVLAAFAVISLPWYLFTVGSFPVDAWIVYIIGGIYLYHQHTSYFSKR